MPRKARKRAIQTAAHSSDALSSDGDRIDASLASVGTSDTVEPLHEKQSTPEGHADTSTPPQQRRLLRRISKRMIIVCIAIGFILGVVFFPRYIQESPLLSLLPDAALLKLHPYWPSSPISTAILTNLTDILRPFQMWSAQSDSALGDPGKMAQDFGWRVHYPVFIIPGLTSTGLELWQGKKCAESYFRQRLWGTLTMLRFLLMDKSCWIDHVILDHETGLDPPGVKLRAAQGLEAADFIMPGYWVWGKIIEALGCIGYDQNTIHLAAYDWRLSMEGIEERDGYFSRLKSNLELSLRVQNGRRAVILSHSMGSQVWLYFAKWVESEKGGRGGVGWIDRHVHSFFNIAGPLLGLPKLVSSLISGEMKDTAQLGVLESYMLESLFSKKERAALFRSWPGLLSMFPKGGETLWGNGLVAPDDDDDYAIGPMVSIPELGPRLENFTITEIIGVLKASTLLPSHTASKILAPEFYGIPRVSPSGPEFDDPRCWSNPFHYTLPPGRMKVYCGYGVGKDTERAYFYALNHDDLVGSYKVENTSAVPFFLEARAAANRSLAQTFVDAPLFPIVINTSTTNDAHRIYRGVRYTDGDGTVPLLSTGFMCVNAWKTKKYNPSSVPVVTREYLHDPVSLVSSVRGGPRTSDHVDILGNYQMTLDILQIVSGNDESRDDGDGAKDSGAPQPRLGSEANRTRHHRLGDMIHSKIKQFAARVKM